MQIIIDTDGLTKNTSIQINGKKVEKITEFHFDMNPHRKKNGYILEGKCKMTQFFDGDFRSIFGEDFKYLDGVGLNVGGGQ
jgi:hypothetical protein